MIEIIAPDSPTFRLAGLLCVRTTLPLAEQDLAYWEEALPRCLIPRIGPSRAELCSSATGGEGRVASPGVV